jgi:hypothetical protein
VRLRTRVSLTVAAELVLPLVVPRAPGNFAVESPWASPLWVSVTVSRCYSWGRGRTLDYGVGRY